MAIQGLDYWYDGQMRRFLEQIVRAFSGFQYMTGGRNGEEPQLKMVPCRMANRNRMTAQIMRNNSENTLLTCPLITIEQTALEPRREDLMNPLHVDTVSVAEREVDPATGQYVEGAGNRYTVRRMMPRPFQMSIQVDIWTSNMSQKHQLLEQILCIFMPDIQIQNSDNAVDWTARTLLTLDTVSFSSQSIPIGSSSETDIDIATLTFKLPMYFSPPVEVTQERIIRQIVANVGSAEVLDKDFPASISNPSQVVVTPGNHRLMVDGNYVTLLGPKGALHDDEGNIYRWDDLLRQYGTFRPAVSEIRIKRDGLEDDREIIGSLQFDDNHPNRLFWQIDPDTLPPNTLDPINGVINPLETFPYGGLPAPSNNTRYLLLNDIGPSEAWGGLSASANDVIRYTNGSWQVSFDASASNAASAHMVNLFSGTQYRWTGEQWQLALGGDYGPGHWRLIL